MKNRTVGIDPKLYPAAFACLLGIVVALLVDKATGLAILGTGVAALGVGAALPAPVVITEITDPDLLAPRDGVGPDDVLDEAGYAVIELAIGVVVLLILVFVLLRIAG